MSQLGQLEPSANTNLETFPIESFQEAIALTSGMPYAQREAVKLSGDAASADEASLEELATVDSAKHEAIAPTHSTPASRPPSLWTHRSVEVLNLPNLGKWCVGVASPWGMRLLQHLNFPSINTLK
jgi:hypothetical protein